MIYIASDHAGINLKKEISVFFKSIHIKLIDLGPKILNQDDDFPDFAFRLTKKVLLSPKNFGILICRNGIGMSIAANKVNGIRAGLCTEVGQAVTARAHDNCNVLVLSSDFVSLKKNIEIIKTFLEGEFSPEGRYQRRLKKIEDFERGQK